jgi:hypothetical protein
MNQVSRVWSANFHFFERHIPRKEAIAKAAGEDIAYYCDATVRGWFDELGGAISQRLWPEPVLARYREAQNNPRLSQALGVSAPAPAE